MKLYISFLLLIVSLGYTQPTHADDYFLPGIVCVSTDQSLPGVTGTPYGSIGGGFLYGAINALDSIIWSPNSRIVLCPAPTNASGPPTYVAVHAMPAAVGDTISCELVVLSSPSLNLPPVENYGALASFTATSTTRHQNIVVPPPSYSGTYLSSYVECSLQAQTKASILSLWVNNP